jgi:lysophospholipase L1-like esterase
MLRRLAALTPRPALALFLVAVLATGCAGADDPPPSPDDVASATILALGDSVIEWNAGDAAAIPDVIAQALGRDAFNAAVSGARFTHPDADAAEAGFDIRAQYRALQDDVPDKAWTWVVLDGGANDFGDECGCTSGCDVVMADLLGADGRTGAIPAFVEKVTARGSRVLYMGYYDAPEAGGGGFEACGDDFATFNARLARMADALDGAFYASAAAVIDPADLSHYDADRVHPSVLGSRLIGEHLAEAIEAAEAQTP